MIQSLFKSSIYAIKIWDRYLWLFGNEALFSNVAISVIFSSFFILTFDWKGNSEFWWFHHKDLVQIYWIIPINVCFSFAFFFLQITSKFNDLINSECLIKMYLTLSSSVFKKHFNWIKKRDYLFIMKEWKIQVIMSMIMLTRFLEMIFNLMRYTGLNSSQINAEFCYYFRLQVGHVIKRWCRVSHIKCLIHLYIYISINYLA